MEVNMKPSGLDDGAFTGLEVAMVFIAFIVVASIFAYAALSAGFFTTQKTEQTVYSAVQQVGTVIQIVEPVMVQAGSSGDSVRYITITVKGSSNVDIDVERIVVTVSTAEAMQTYKGATFWHPVSKDRQPTAFWSMRIPLYRADEPAATGDLIISQNQRFFIEIKSTEAISCMVERRVPAGMRPGSWYEV